MIFKEILEVKGYKARTIQLIRQLGSGYDTHVVTEVYDEKLNKFILLDPTFNLMFKSNDKYLNANEIKDIVLYKKGKLEILNYSKDKIAKYKEYYVDYFLLYNNVLLVRTNNLIGYKRLVSKLPIIHNYLGGKYFTKDNDSVKGFAVLYKLFYIYIPIFLLVNLVLILFISITSIKRKNK